MCFSIIVLKRILDLKIFFPDSGPKGKDTNKYSIVAKLYYGNSTFIFTGDAPTDVENFLTKMNGKEIERSFFFPLIIFMTNHSIIKKFQRKYIKFMD